MIGLCEAAKGKDASLVIAALTAATKMLNSKRHLKPYYKELADALVDEHQEEVKLIIRCLRGRHLTWCRPRESRRTQSFGDEDSASEGGYDGDVSGGAQSMFLSPPVAAAAVMVADKPLVREAVKSWCAHKGVSFVARAEGIKHMVLWYRKLPP